MSMIKRALDNGIIDIKLKNLRDFSEGKHQQADSRPYGGGSGMVLMAEPVFKAIESARGPCSHVVYLTPQGKPLTAKRCKELSLKNHLIILCGHYKGIDERVIDLHVDEEISIGDFVLTSGAPAAVALVDSVSRFIPGVMGNEDSTKEDSFEEGLFDAPVYTRPPIFKGMAVPDVLLSGDHAKINKWRKDKATKKTKLVRPDLVKVKS